MSKKNTKIQDNNKESNFWVYIIIIVTICVSGIIIYNSNTKSQANNNVEAKNQFQGFENVSYIEDDHTIPRIKLSLNVYVSKRIDEIELKDLAEKIYSKYDGEDYENTFIEYLLPGMEPGNGCYATSHYNPDFNMQIFGVTEKELSDIKSKFDIKGRYWLDSGWKILLTIEKKKNKYYLNKYANDFSTGKTLLLKDVKKADTIYRISDAIDNAYYLINSNNELEIYDNQGYVDKYLQE